MLYLTLDIRHRYLTCYHSLDMLSHGWHAITRLTCYTWPDIVTPDWLLLYLTPILYCIFITFSRTRHDYYVVTRLLVLLNLCTPELLYSWTPVTGRLLILYSWYYTPVNPRNWIIMVIGLLYTSYGHYLWAIYIIKYSTYTGVGETDINRYDVIFIMVIFLKCRVGRIMISPRKQ